VLVLYYLMGITMQFRSILEVAKANWSWRRFVTILDEEGRI